MGALTILEYVNEALHFNGQGGEALRTKIAELRKQQQLTQEELARAVGVSRQTIISIENGKYTASLLLAYKISHYFKKTIEEVFDFTGED
jgi:putative transcriptional regulator